MKKTFKLIVTVTYEMNGTPDAAIRDILLDIPYHAADAGVMSSDTDAEVDTWEAEVEEVKL